MEERASRLDGISNDGFVMLILLQRFRETPLVGGAGENDIEGVGDNALSKFMFFHSHSSTPLTCQKPV